VHTHKKLPILNSLKTAGIDNPYSSVTIIKMLVTAGLLPRHGPPRGGDGQGDSRRLK